MGAVAEQPVGHREPNAHDAVARTDTPDLLRGELGVERRDQHVQIEARLDAQPVVTEVVVEGRDKPGGFVGVGPRVDYRRLDRDQDHRRDAVGVEVLAPNVADVASRLPAARRHTVLTYRVGEVMRATRRAVIQDRHVVADAEPRKAILLGRREVRGKRRTAFDGWMKVTVDEAGKIQSVLLHGRCAARGHDTGPPQTSART